MQHLRCVSKALAGEQAMLPRSSDLTVRAGLGECVMCMRKVFETLRCRQV